MKKIFLFAVSLIITVQVSGQGNNYTDDINEWRKTRIERLKAESGWLNLAGLFWLNEGENTIGSDKKNSIKFETKNTAGFLGKVIVNKDEIWFETSEEAKVLNNDTIVSRIRIFPYDRFPVTLKHNRIIWFIIQRGEKFAIRLRDLDGEYLRAFKGIDYFDINPQYVVKAKFIPTPGKKITITDATGRVYDQESPGKVVFKIGNIDCSLEPTGNLKQLSYVFADETTNDETYGGGRFLESKGPDENGEIILDFNKAYNPPCVFTPYATCPLPTKENILKVAIKAGEKDNSNHEH